MRYQDFYQLAGDELRPDANAHVTLAIRADQKFAPRNSMLNADTRFPGFAMRIKEDQCSYTNHQNDVTYYNMVTQHKNSKFPIIQQSSSTSIIHYKCHTSVALYMFLHSETFTHFTFVFFLLNLRNSMGMNYKILFVIYTRTSFYACLFYAVLLQHPLPFYTGS